MIIRKIESFILYVSEDIIIANITKKRTDNYLWKRKRKEEGNSNNITKDWSRWCKKCIKRIINGWEIILLRKILLKKINVPEKDTWWKIGKRNKAKWILKIKME